jgi:hypothetical protein
MSRQLGPFQFPMPARVRTGRTRAGRLVAAGVLVGGGLLGCSPGLQPVDATTRLNDRPASDVVLSLPQACSMVPGNGLPSGRPEGVHDYTLPPGTYLPRFRDEHGVFFASPTGVVINEPISQKGTHTRAGGIYIYVRDDKRDVAMQYLGDEDGVSERDRLPEHCHYSIESVAQNPTPKPG